MANNGQRLGITEPISLGGPTEYDVMKTRELEKVNFLFLFLYKICFYFVSWPVIVDLWYFCLKLCWTGLLGFWVFQYLQDAGLYESQEEAVGREEVLGRLDQVEFFLSLCLVAEKNDEKGKKVVVFFHIFPFFF